MKTFLNSLKTSFLVIGTIIGSGFISGREIVVFFGGKNIFLSALAAAVAFFAVTFLLLEIGRNYRTLAAADRALFGKADKTVDAAMFVCLFAVAAAGAATVDSLGAQLFGIPKIVPVFSVMSLAAAWLCAGKGVGSIAVVDVILVPVMLVLTLAFCLAKGGFDFTPVASGGTRTLIYVSFNMFLSAAVVIEAGAGGTSSSSAFVSAVSALLTAIFVILIYGVVRYEGVNALEADLPLLYALAPLGRTCEFVFAAVLFTGAFTTLVAAYYPLGKAFTAKLGKRGDLTAVCAVFLLSRFGIKDIVGYAYPAAGILGLIYFAFLAARYTYKSLRKSK